MAWCTSWHDENKYSWVPGKRKVRIEQNEQGLMSGNREDFNVSGSSTKIVFVLINDLYYKVKKMFLPKAYV